MYDKSQIHSSFLSCCFSLIRSHPNTRRSRKRRKKRRRRKRRRSIITVITTVTAVEMSLCRMALWKRRSLCRSVNIIMLTHVAARSMLHSEKGPLSTDQSHYWQCRHTLPCFLCFSFIQPVPLAKSEHHVTKNAESDLSHSSAFSPCPIIAYWGRTPTSRWWVIDQHAYEGGWGLGRVGGTYRSDTNLFLIITFNSVFCNNYTTLQVRYHVASVYKYMNVNDVMVKCLQKQRKIQYPHCGVALLGIYISAAKWVIRSSSWYADFIFFSLSLKTGEDADQVLTVGRKVKNVPRCVSLCPSFSSKLPQSLVSLQMFFFFFSTMLHYFLRIILSLWFFSCGWSLATWKQWCVVWCWVHEFWHAVFIVCSNRTAINIYSFFCHKVYDIQGNLQDGSQVVVSVIFENKCDSVLKSMEFNVLDSLNSKLQRPEGAGPHDGLTVPFQLPPGQWFVNTVCFW